MNKLLLCLFVVSLTTSVFAQYNSTNLKAEYGSENSYTYGNLRLYPVRANDVFLALHENIGDYTVLEDAVEEKKIVVTEVSGSGTVNTLFAENLSTDSIYVMAGEIVKGGKQDRIIAQDFILAPGEKVDVGAFCVEHGRWSAGFAGSNREGVNDFSQENGMVLEYSTKAPVFEETAKVVSTDVREAAIVKKNQSEVWDEVAIVTSQNGASSGTGTYNQLENTTVFQDTLKKYLDHFNTLFKNDKTIIGVVAVTGNEIIATDLFATNHLFINQYENLLHSYITSAISDGKPITIGSESVQKYLDEFLSDESLQKSLLDKEGSQFEFKGKVVHCTRF